MNNSSINVMVVKCYLLKIKVIASTAYMIVPMWYNFFQNVTKQDIHVNKYKNMSFHQQQIDQYITYLLAIFLFKNWVHFIKAGRNHFFVILRNNSAKHCFMYFFGLRKIEINKTYDKYFIFNSNVSNINFVLLKNNLSI